MTEAPKTWNGFARRVHGDGAAFSSVNLTISENQLAFAGLDTRITVTEDATGDHLGWIDAGHQDDPPTMIQHQKIFDISFPYGSQAAVEAGRGRIVRLSVAAADTRE